VRDRGAGGAQTNVFARWVSRRTIRRRKPAATADGASTEAPPKKRSKAKRNPREAKASEGKGRRARRRGGQRTQLVSLLRLNVATDLFAKNLFFPFNFFFLFFFFFTKDSYGDRFYKPFFFFLFFLFFFLKKRGKK
jgi:hypothetical protein